MYFVSIMGAQCTKDKIQITKALTMVSVVIFLLTTASATLGGGVVTSGPGDTATGALASTIGRAKADNTIPVVKK